MTDDEADLLSLRIEALTASQLEGLVAAIGSAAADVRTRGTPRELMMDLRQVACSSDALEKRIRRALDGVTATSDARSTGPVRVALLGVEAELGDALTGVQALLQARRGQVSEVRRFDLAGAGPGVLSAARACELRVVVLGAACGGAAGAGVVTALFNAGDTIGAKVAAPGVEAITRFVADVPHSALLWARCAHSFGAPADAAGALRKAVSAWLDAHVPMAPGEAAGLTGWESEYLRTHLPTWVRGGHKALLDRKTRSVLARSQLYVGLDADVGDVWVGKGKVRWPGEEEWKRGRSRKARSPEDVKKRTPLPMDHALCLPRFRAALVVGEAGSGKTVLLQHLAAALVAPLLEGELSAEDLAELAAETAEVRLDRGALGERPPIPLVFEARELAALPTTTAPVAAIEALLRARCADCPTLTDLGAGLRAGRYWLLVDSLDEVATGAGRANVVRILTGLTRHGPSRILLTSRPGAHAHAEIPPELRPLRLAPLDDAHRARMVERWASAQRLDPAARERLDLAVASLRGRFAAGAGDRPIEDNPLLLTCILLVFQEKQRLPENTADLYRRMIDILCEGREPRREELQGLAPRPAGTGESDAELARADSAGVRLGLARAVAWAIQDEVGTTALRMDRLAQRLCDDPDIRAPNREAGDALVHRLIATTGLFRTAEETEGVVVRPWHRSFQEYLAATRMVGEDVVVAERVRRLTEAARGRTPRMYDPAWRGTLLFLTGAMGQRAAGRAIDLISALLDEAGRAGGPREVGTLCALAAAGVAEYHLEFFTNQDTLRERLGREVLARFAAGGAGWGWRDRVAALDAVGALGLDDRWPDPRRDAGGWVEIPAGEWNVGGEGVNALPERRVNLGRFYVLHRPVTVGDWAGFLAEGGAADARWGAASLPARPDGWVRQERHPNHPVTGVSWDEARAFCRWATERWVLPGEGRVDLPTSTEWEAVARGDGPGPFPWGDELGSGDSARANHRWDGECPGETTPVGAFPAGDMRRRGQALHDRVGNVWVWTRTEWVDTRAEGDGPRPDDDTHLALSPDDALRVVRGGSWGLLPKYLWCAGRGRASYPVGRFDRLGFRVVFRPPARFER